MGEFHERVSPTLIRVAEPSAGRASDVVGVVEEHFGFDPEECSGQGSAGRGIQFDVNVVPAVVDLVPFVPALDEAEAVEMLRGRS